MKRDVWRGVYKSVRAVAAFLGLAITIIGASLKADPESLEWDALASLIVTSQLHAGWLIPILALTTGVLTLTLRILGPPWVWDTVHEVLDELRERVFEDRVGELHHHRVTLFKYKSFCWRKCLKIRDRGWLIPVERSGHTTRKSSVLFNAPDDADGAEGIAGHAWASDGTVEVSDLPDLSDRPSEEDIRTYARRSNVTPEWVRRERPLARSLSGFPVEARGRRWGVIVLDSRSPNAIADELKSYKLVGRFLGRLLARI